MKTIKTFDLWFQAALIIVFAVLSLVKLDTTFIIGYFVVGGWQSLSMLTHAVNGWFFHSGSRRLVYTIISAVCISLMLLALVVPGLFLFYYLMLFAAPFMAVYYWASCYREVYWLMKRPLESI